MREETWRAYLYCREHDMGLAGDADDDRTLLDGFLCVFYLEDATLWRAKWIVSTVD